MLRFPGGLIHLGVGRGLDQVHRADAHASTKQKPTHNQPGRAASTSRWICGASRRRRRRPRRRRSGGEEKAAAARTAAATATRTKSLTDHARCAHIFASFCSAESHHQSSSAERIARISQCRCAVCPQRKVGLAEPINKNRFGSAPFFSTTTPPSSPRAARAGSIENASPSTHLLLSYTFFSPCS